jgi:hypothetical protein
MALHHSPRIVTNGLVLCLDAGNRKSYSGSGNVWRDLAGSNNGTLTNSPTFSSANGGSIAFDGANDFVIITNNISLNTPNNTLVCWAKSNVENWNEYGFLLSKRNIYIIHPTINTKNVNYYYRLNDNWIQEMVTVPNITIWNMYACSWDGTRINAYLNGSLIKSGVKTGLLNTGDTNSLEIGRDSGNSSRILNGNISIAQIYNRALTPAEIQQNYNATKGRYKL